MTEKEKLDYLAEHGINVGTGMKYADDSMEFYEQLIGIFTEEYEEKKNRVQEEGNCPGKEYTVLVHGLKNNARYLGADELADLAYEHEKASKSNDLSYIIAHLDILFEKWERTVQIFKKMNN